MNHVVSYETAIRLKDAGFPQPNRGFFYSFIAGDETGDIRGGWYFFKPQDQFDPIYAPCATELLPINWTIVRYRNEWMVLSEHSLVTWEHFGYGDTKFIDNENPAEAAAGAWLYVNQNKEQ